jgi:hypothetical protein
MKHRFCDYLPENQIHLIAVGLKSANVVGACVDQTTAVCAGPETSVSFSVEFSVVSENDEYRANYSLASVLRGVIPCQLP